MKASDLIRQGWIRHGHAADELGCKCKASDSSSRFYDVVSALFLTTSADDNAFARVLREINRRRLLRFHELRASGEATDAELRRLREYVNDLATWNDAAERTQFEVIEILEAVGL